MSVTRLLKSPLVSFKMIPMEITATIKAFDDHLAKRGLSLEAVVIGGAALNLLGVVSRFTRDCDVLTPKLPEEIKKASIDFANECSARGDLLEENWLNNGPSTLTNTLPSNWSNHLQELFVGTSLKLKTLGRMDLLRSKLFAYCDRETDLDDCKKLNPTREELLEALPWVSYQDANPLWPDHVQMKVRFLAKELGYEL